MVIYLKHEVHGTKVAMSDEEAVADEKKGWKRFTIEPLKIDRAKQKKEEAASQERWLKEEAERKRVAA